MGSSQAFCASCSGTTTNTQYKQTNKQKNTLPQDQGKDQESFGFSQAPCAGCSGTKTNTQYKHRNK